MAQKMIIPQSDKYLALIRLGRHNLFSYVFNTYDEADYFLDKLTCYENYVEVYFIIESDEDDGDVEVNVIKVSYPNLHLLAETFRKNAENKLSISNGLVMVGNKFLHTLVLNNDFFRFANIYQFNGSENIEFLNGDKLDNRLANIRVIRNVLPR